MKRAFTLVETLLVISIVAVIAAIMFPVLAAAKKNAYKATTTSNLRQLWMSIDLYRQDQNASADSGLPSEMGLPETDYFHLQIAKKNGLNPPFKGPSTWFHNYHYYPPAEDFAQQDLLDNWVAWTKACTSETVLVADFNFTERPVGPLSGFVSKNGIGVRLNGQIARKQAVGDYATVGWWGCARTEKKR